MLVKVKFGDAQKFVKITELTLKEFLSAAFIKFGIQTEHKNVMVVDESGTEVDEDVFEDVVKDPSIGILIIKPCTGSAFLQASPVQSHPSSSIDSTFSNHTLIIEESPSSKRIKVDDEAKKFVESILVGTPGGKCIINEYNRTKCLKDQTRRKMVNILAADLVENNSTSPPKHLKEQYARGIVALFPHLSDPFSKNGYEHYYDIESGTGYLAWRIKNIQRGIAKERRASYKDFESTSPHPSMSSSIDSTDFNYTVFKESCSSQGIMLDDEAKKLVEIILLATPGGECIISEYNRTKSLKDQTRRKMVNILAADIVENNGTSPPRLVKENYARGIVALFPNLCDPYSKNGYEHYYDCKSGTGYLAWRIKTIQRSLAKERRGTQEGRVRYTLTGQGSRAEGVLWSAAPAVKQEPEFPPVIAESPLQQEPAFTPATVFTEDECDDAISFMNQCADEDTVKKKMILTFPYRHNMPSCDMLRVFSRFKDVKGLIEQDFVLLFGGEVSGRLLDKWTTTFKSKVIQQCKKRPITSDIEQLLQAAEPPTDDSENEDDGRFGWDSDLASILLLLHLIPPSAQGRKRPGKMSASQAERHVVVFKESGTDNEIPLQDVTASSHPYLLAVGPQKNSIQQYFIILHQHVIPCMSTSSLGAFDELFKAHFVFGTSFNAMLHNMYTFLQTTVYNIGIGKVKESPRVAEVRVRLLS